MCHSRQAEPLAERKLDADRRSRAPRRVDLGVATETACALADAGDPKVRPAQQVEVADADGALAAVAEHAPDVLVLDMEMPGGGGLAVTEQLATDAASPPVLILSAYEDEAYIFGVLDAGAAGYLSKQEPLERIAEAVRGVGAGDAGWLSRQIGALYVRSHRQGRDRRVRLTQAEAALATMTKRERSVVLLVAEGLTNAEIAERLFLSEGTVRKYVHVTYEKLGLRTRAQVVAWAWRLGLMTPDE